MTIQLDNMNVVQKVIKCLADIVTAAILMVVLSPVFLVMFCRRKKGETAILRTECIGLDGEPFTLYHFRSNGWTSYLPELWNVLKGDMSLVGPRPQTQAVIDAVSLRTGDYISLLQIRPGIFSESANFLGTSDNPDAVLRRLPLDLRYLEHRTLWMDLSIVLNTTPFLHSKNSKLQNLK